MGAGSAPRHALIVGVEAYASNDFPAIPTVPEDVGRLRDTLARSAYEVEVVPGAQLTYNQIRGRLKAFLTDERLRDATVLVFLSGHGLSVDGADYLVPQDAYSLDAVRAEPKRALVDTDVRAYVNASPARTVVLFVDACRETLDSKTKAVLHPFGAELEQRAHQKMVTVFGCQPGGFCHYDEKELGASFFAAALCHALAPEHPAVSLGEVLDGANEELQRLVAAHRPGVEQRLHYAVADEVGGGLLAREVARGRPNLWRAAVAGSRLWPAGEESGELRAAVTAFVEDLWPAGATAGTEDPWRDLRFPLRCIEHAETLLGDAPCLHPLEVAALLAAPFIREAVLQRGFAEWSDSQPLELQPMADAPPRRVELEATHDLFPRITAKARTQEEPERTALATWLLHRAVVRDVDLWRSPATRELTEALGAVLDQPQRKAAAAGWLQAVALHVAAVREDLSREGDTDKPALEARQSSYAGGAKQRLRPRALAILLALAGQMAVDPRQLGDVVLNHVGAHERLWPADVAQTADGMIWSPSSDRQVLRLAAVCPHPAIHVALQEQARRIEDLLDLAHREREELSAELAAPFEALPRRVVMDEVEPGWDANGARRYETPLLRFRLAHDEIRDLLMGVQLYGDASLAIRELYQNALDACRYREARARYLKQAYEGRIAFRQGVRDGRVFVECEDNGIGMGMYELEQVFSRAGRRFVHTPEYLWERAKWREHRPDIELWPNSRFGIGVFSYFMLADEIEIETARAHRSTGRADDELHVRISSSGSLFRIRRVPSAAPHRRAGGTLIRLYLRDAVAVSCRAVLADALRVADYAVSCAEGERELHWPPGELRLGPDAAEHMIRRGDAWLLPDQGGLLADGIVTDEVRFGYVVNLTGPHQPVLSVDRKHVEAFDAAAVEAALEAAVDAVPAADGPLGYWWLWGVTEGDPPLGQQLWERLAGRDVALVVSGGEDVEAPVAELGCFPTDAYHLMYGRSVELSSDAVAPELDVQRLLTARERLHLSLGLLSRSQRSRWVTPETADWLPVLDALDWVLLAADPKRTALTTIGTQRRSSLAVRVVQASRTFRRPLREVLARAQRLTVVGAVVPWDPAAAPEGDRVADEADEALVGDLEDVPAGQAILTAARLAARASTPGEWEHQLERYGALRAAGLGLPALDLEALGPARELLDRMASQSMSWLDHGWTAVVGVCRGRDDLPVQLARLRALFGDDPQLAAAERCLADETELRALSRDADGEPPWVGRLVPAEHVARLAARFGVEVDAALFLLQPYVRLLGLDLPRADEARAYARIADSPMRRAMDAEYLSLEWPDRLLVSSDLDGMAPFLSGVVPVEQMLVVAAETQQALGAVGRRLDELEGTLPVAAPPIPEALAGWVPRRSHSTLLRARGDALTSYSRSLRASLGDGGAGRSIAPLHVVLAAIELAVRVGEAHAAAAEMRPLFPDVAEATAASRAQLDEVEPDERDVLLLRVRAFSAGEPIGGAVDAMHLLHCSLRLGWPLGRVHDRLSALAPLGLELPPAGGDTWREAIPEWRDLVVLSAKRDGGAPLVPGPVPDGHVERAAGAVGETPEQVRDRLALHAAPFRLEV